MPRHDAFSRLFRQLGPEQVGSAFRRFMAAFSRSCEGVGAIDGKGLRRCFDRAGGRSPLHMVSVWGCEQRMVLAQVATNAKFNEIAAVPALLKMLSLKGTIVTADALPEDDRPTDHRWGGDCCLALNGHQGTLHDEVERHRDDPASEIGEKPQRNRL